jgi:pimeloyl-ACP methyl ester carboxylesterase
MTRTTLRRPDATLVATDVGEGPVILMLHAGGERRQVWDPVSDLLSGSGWRCVAYDLRGHGESSGDGLLPAHATDVRAMVEAIAVRPVVVGASLGGLATMLAASEHETRAAIAGLVLVDVVPDPDAGRVRAFLARYASGSNRRSEDGLRRAPELRAAAAKLVDVPTLLVRAGGPSPLSEADANRFAGLVPTARVEVIPEASHLIARDAPGALARLVEEHASRPEVRARWSPGPSYAKGPH